MKKLLLAILLFSSPCLAGSAIGVMTGPSLVGNSVGLQFADGIEYSHPIGPHFVLGGFILREGLGSGTVNDPLQNLTVSLSSGITIIAAHGRYCFKTDSDGFDLGVILGLGLFSESASTLQNGDQINSINRSSTRIVLGPSVGYSLPLNANWVFNPRLNYLYTEAGSDLPGFGSFMLLATVRYLF